LSPLVAQPDEHDSAHSAVEFADEAMEFKEQTAFEQFVNERFYNRLIVGGGAPVAAPAASASSSAAAAAAAVDSKSDVQLKISYAGMLRVGIDFHTNPPRGRHPCEVWHAHIACLVCLF
jgi:hypothetical protein